MTDWQQRVIDEKTVLDEKRNKLTAFLNGDETLHLDVMEQERLQRQERIMLDYSIVLGERIAAFK